MCGHVLPLYVCIYGYMLYECVCVNACVYAICVYMCVCLCIRVYMCSCAICVETEVSFPAISVEAHIYIASSVRTHI